MRKEAYKLPEPMKRKPDWLKIDLPKGQKYKSVLKTVVDGGLHTVCQEARCPNIGACWDAGAATFMILGDVCTRGCRFCAVRRGEPPKKVDSGEPVRVADAASRMGLEYAVVTSVTRDDLKDGGASVFRDTVRALKNLSPAPRVELLIPDFTGYSLDVLFESKPDVFAHNIEVVERLTSSMRHPRFSYRRSLGVLSEIRLKDKEIRTKSSIMLGLGETEKEVEDAMRDLRSAGVDILVLGQYLRPTREQAEVVEYVHPDRFQNLKVVGEEMGFKFVMSSPLARTSYKAAEAFAS
jgi:lipoic acid synthetase